MSAQGASVASQLAEAGRRLVAVGKPQAAVEQFRIAIGSEPNDPNLHILLAWALSLMGSVDEAEIVLERAIALDPESATAYSMLGFRRQEHGAFASALQCFERAVALDPRQAGSYFGIAQSKKITEADREMVEQMLALVAQPDTPLPDRGYLHYALGKAFDDLKEYEPAIQHFDRANRLSATDPSLRAASFDRRAHQNLVNDTIARYTASFVSSRRSAGSESAKPIFIVGMPRSGTTLAEQVLSSHPQVAAGGELKFWRDDAREWRQMLLRGGSDESVRAKTERGYLALIDPMAGNNPHLTDKMPINYLFLGAIHLLFPHAKIIHCRRHPVDTCLSIFMTRIMPPEYTNDRRNIVFVYHQYERLMNHWKRVLPAESVMDVHYEQLVADQNGVSRQMIEFCGLEWDDACLRPEQNIRKVMTPSLWQTRQPIYKSSLERWRNYEPWLGEFRDLLPG